MIIIYITIWFTINVLVKDKEGKEKAATLSYAGTNLNL